jgi:putative DNA methylase
MTNIFERHDFAFKWSYAEMVPIILGIGYDWAIDQTVKCIGELIELARPDIDIKKAKRNAGSGDLLSHNQYTMPPLTVTARSADNLDYLEDGSIDLVTIDPPYYDNVMYAELSDFFYSQHRLPPYVNGLVCALMFRYMFAVQASRTAIRPGFLKLAPQPLERRLV